MGATIYKIDLNYHTIDFLLLCHHDRLKDSTVIGLVWIFNTMLDSLMK